MKTANPSQSHLFRNQLKPTREILLGRRVVDFGQGVLRSKSFLINSAQEVDVFQTRVSHVAGEIDVKNSHHRNSSPATPAFENDQPKQALTSADQQQAKYVDNQENSNLRQLSSKISMIEKAEQLDVLPHAKQLVNSRFWSVGGNNQTISTYRKQMSSLGGQAQDQNRHHSVLARLTSLIQPMIFHQLVNFLKRPGIPDLQAKPGVLAASDWLTTVEQMATVEQTASSDALIAKEQPTKSDRIATPNWIKTQNQFDMANEPDMILEAQRISQPRPTQSIWRAVARLGATMIMIVAFTIAAAIIVPELYYTIFAGSAVEDVAKQAQEQQLEDSKEQVKEPYLPVKNLELPTGAWVSIPRIGVYSELIPSESPSEALDKGTWLVPDFGRPGDDKLPTIIAAHRYGWDWWWQSDYWKYNSFYLLTETQPGDRVEVIYDQRRWVYEIYAAEEGELITDYSADLILYTCKHLNSPIRHFRYANLVVPE